ncbi:MAG: hypothetical protein IT456_10625 [Planctomycetes bacterium]|nr:hypothetical protein [Planctomycetota bacterium]
MLLLVDALSVDDVLPTASYTAQDNATIATIAVYTDSIESRLPAALVGGRMDASVGAMEAAAVAAILDEVVEGTVTHRQLLRLGAAVLLGKLSGAGTATEVFRGILDDKDRVTATVDAAGNRTAIILDAA